MPLAISNHALRMSGGIERYALTLVRGLHQRGVRPVLVAKKIDPSLPEAQWVDAVQVPTGFVPGKLRDMWFDWRLRRLKKRLNLHPLIACNQTGAADIAICGSTHPGFLEAMQLPTRTIDRWKISLERAHLERSQVIVAHSRLMAEQVQRFYGIPAAKIDVLYPPVDTDRFHTVDTARREQLRQALQLPADRATFLLVSTGHKRKGLDQLVEFFRATTLPVSLAVAGRPIDVQSPNIRYLGYRSDIEDAYRAADFTVIASRFEPFGLVGVESVLCGTPIVVADTVGCAEVVRSSAAMSFTRDDPSSFGRAIAQAVDRWRAGTHRIAAPLAALSYDPGVDAHLDALLRHAEAIAPGSVKTAS
ncbi:glycosyltransferase family 4 protein [Piscinibacter terrae]|uniref:Glycosyltransferase n=1 Tax=Piscinibacter terrae TaxID=2496871 RepID=A0A3N7HXD2_9BURK|nr:glycosyltransferase family 4 protein [Albitalea terrae]RQP25721.1 glycosyltransferase [Albitalea terrae]